MFHQHFLTFSGNTASFASDCIGEDLPVLSALASSRWLAALRDRPAVIIISSEFLSLRDRAGHPEIEGSRVT